MAENITDSVIDEAEKWHKIFADDQGTYDQRVEFTDWYEQSLVHQKAYAQVSFAQEAGFDFASTGAAAPESMNKQEVASSLGEFLNFLRRPSMQYGAMSAALVMAVVLVFMPYYNVPELTRYATPTNETRLVTLSDGSEVLLGARTAMKVGEFSDTERRVYLTEGEALFSVSRDIKRPFVVVSEGTRVEVLGTKFNINKAREIFEVSLLEGRVNVVQETEGNIIPFLTTEKTVELSPDHSVAVKAGVLQTVTEQNSKTMATWVDGQLTYKATPFVRVIADLQRYTSRSLFIADVSLEDLPVTATFSTESVDSVIENFPYILPLELNISTEGTYVFRKKKNFVTLARQF